MRCRMLPHIGDSESTRPASLCLLSRPRGRQHSTWLTRRYLLDHGRYLHESPIFRLLNLVISDALFWGRYAYRWRSLLLELRVHLAALPLGSGPAPAKTGHEVTLKL